MKRKYILTCAVTGNITTPEQTPYLPITPEQIANAAIEAAKAGAAVSHIHVRDPATGRPSMSLDLYREVVDRIRSSGTDVVINLTTGPGGRFVPDRDDPRKPGPGTTLLPPDQRVEHIVALKPEIATLDCNVMWSGTGVVMNTPWSITRMAELIYGAGTIPELEVFDSGDIALAKHLIDQGVLKGKCLWQVCMGIRFGFDWNPETLNYAKSIIPAGHPWAAFAIGRMEFPMLAQAWLLGGHVRVGLEDNIYLNKGELAVSNTVLVERAVRILKEFGAEPMTAAEARAELAQVGGWQPMSRGVLVVTGAGRGIGAAIATAAAADGWAVAVNFARDAESANATVRAIEAAGGTARAIQADVQSEAGIAALFEAADSMGRVKGLVNNAGGSAEARIADITAADYDRMMDGNLRPTVFCAREAVRRMATDRGGEGGVIVNIGSRASVLGGQPGRVMYAAAKGAVDGFTAGLANEVGKLGIRVCCIRPGVIRTESHEARAGADRLKQITAPIALGRPGEPEEVAALAVFLLSPGAAYMTGTLVDIGGGR